MASTSLYIDTVEITNETQLTFQTHEVEELITKQINSEYGVSDIMTIITLLVALGAMMISLVANRISSISNLEKKDIFSLIIAAVILVGCLGYGIYAECKQRTDRVSIQTQIANTIISIENYKKENR